MDKKGLDNAKVRLAIAYAINYPNIATTAMSDYSDPANASLIMPTGYESKFYDAAAVDVRGLEVRQGQGGRDPRGRAQGQEGLRRHLRAARRDQAGRLEGDHSDRLDRLEHGAARSWPSPPRRSASGSPPSSRRPRPCTPRCRTATSTSSMYSYTGVNPASPWIRFRDALDDRGVAPIGKTAVLELRPVQELRGRGPAGHRGGAPRPTPRPRRPTPSWTRSTARRSPASR